MSFILPDSISIEKAPYPHFPENSDGKTATNPKIPKSAVDSGEVYIGDLQNEPTQLDKDKTSCNDLLAQKKIKEAFEFAKSIAQQDRAGDVRWHVGLKVSEMVDREAKAGRTKIAAAMASDIPDPVEKNAALLNVCYMSKKYAVLKNFTPQFCDDVYEVAQGIDDDLYRDRALLHAVELYIKGKQFEKAKAATSKMINPIPREIAESQLKQKASLANV